MGSEEEEGRVDEEGMVEESRSPRSKDARLEGPSASGFFFKESNIVCSLSFVPVSHQAICSAGKVIRATEPKLVYFIKFTSIPTSHYQNRQLNWKSGTRTTPCLLAGGSKLSSYFLYSSSS